MSNQAEGVVSEYMQGLNWRLANLPSDRREEILSEVREHIDEALPKDGSATREDAVALIEQLGDPAEIADEATALRFGTSVPRQVDGEGNKYMRRYMRRVKRRVGLVPREKREQILAYTQRQIDASLPEGATRKDAEALAERIGDPDQIAEEAYEKFGVQVDRRFAAIFVASTAAAGLLFYFIDGNLAILPVVLVASYGMQIRVTSKNVQVAVYLLAAALAVLLGWIQEGSLFVGIAGCLAGGAVVLAFESYARSKPASRYADAAVKKYMRRLRKRLRPLPREEREEILAGVREHIDESLPKDGSATREDVQRLIERLGGSGEIADDAAQRLRDTRT